MLAKKDLFITIIYLAIFVTLIFLRFFYFDGKFLILASTPTPNPPSITTNPSTAIQAGGHSITFSCPTCSSGGTNEYMKLLICKNNNDLCVLGSSWQYRKPITINNTLNSNALTDYQVLVTLDTQSLVNPSVKIFDSGVVNIDTSSAGEKNLLNFQPFFPSGDNVIIINLEELNTGVSGGTSFTARLYRETLLIEESYQWGSGTPDQEGTNKPWHLLALDKNAPPNSNYTIKINVITPLSGSTTPIRARVMVINLDSGYSAYNKTYVNVPAGATVEVNKIATNLPAGKYIILASFRGGAFRTTDINAGNIRIKAGNNIISSNEFPSDHTNQVLLAAIDAPANQVYSLEFVNNVGTSFYVNSSLLVFAVSNYSFQDTLSVSLPANTETTINNLATTFSNEFVGVISVASFYSSSSTVRPKFLANNIKLQINNDPSTQTTNLIDLAVEHTGNWANVISEVLLNTYSTTTSPSFQTKAIPNAGAYGEVKIVVFKPLKILSSKMRSDCGDIRFTDSDGTTLLNYWIESGCNSASTKIWVKVPSIPASSTKTIYVYYGSPSATSQSSVSNTFIANSIYVMSGSCSDSANCGPMDNHAEADNIRGYPANICTKYVDKIDWGSPCDNSAFNTATRNYFYARFRFLFVPDVTGTWTFGTDSDDASELIKSNADMYGGIHEHTVIASWYGIHGVANSLTLYRGTISLTAGQGVWLEYLYEEWTGNEGGRAGAQKPAGSMLIINTANFPNQIFARKYTSPEPTTSVGEEEILVASNYVWTESPPVVSNPSASYTCPSCTYSVNTYYGVSYNINQSVSTSFTYALQFTCKMEGSSTGSCSCTTNTECFNYCSGWSYIDGTCVNSRCYDSHEGSQYSSTETRSCYKGQLLSNNQASSDGRYANYNGELYYCKGLDNQPSPYPYVTSLSAGSKVGLCYCKQDGSWDCSGIIPIRGGRIRII